MHLEKQFDVRRPRDAAVAIACRDETLLGLFPDTRTELVARARHRAVIFRPREDPERTFAQRLYRLKAPLGVTSRGELPRDESHR